MSSEITSVVGKVGGPDEALVKRARERLDRLTKPPGSLGRLEELAVQVAGLGRRWPPRVEKKAVVVMAADHGVVDEGVSAYPREVTAQMVRNFARGGAAINVLAGHAGAEVVVVDMGVAADLRGVPGLLPRKAAFGGGNIALGPAMTREQALECVRVGVGIVRELVSRGVDLVGTGDMGIGNTTPSSAVTAVMCGKSAGEVTGRGTGVDDAGLARKVKVVERAIAVNRPRPADPLDVLSKLGGFEIGGLAGVILGAAEEGIPVVIDGFVSGAAALLAAAMCPGSRAYMIAGHLSAERGHAAALERLGLRPLLDLGMRLGEGTGAVLAMQIVEAAVKVLNEMATFDEAGVSGKSP